MPNDTNDPSSDVARPQRRQCPSCKNELAPNAVLCVNCGFVLRSGVRLSTEVVSQPKPPPYRRRRKSSAWKLPIGILTVLIGMAPIFCIVFVFVDPSGPAGLGAPEFIIACVITLVPLALGWRLSRASSILQALYMIMFGIIPGYAVIKGFEAIRESLGLPTRRK